MDNDEFLIRHLKLCQRIFDDMMREGSWPWRDSQKSQDLAESEDSQNDV